MFLTNPFAGAFGLDIGDLSIKIVRVEKRFSFRKPKRFVVRDIRTIRLPPGLILNGEIQQPELVRKKLLQLLGRGERGQHRITVPWVIANLPEPKTFLKRIVVDLPGEEVTNDDIVYEARKHLPFALEDTYLDWQIIPGGDTKTTAVLLSAVPKAIADSYTYLLESVNLHPLALEVDAVAIARSLITDTKLYDGEARALLDLGATRSSLIIYDNNSIQLSTTLSFSGEIVTMAIAQQLKLEYTEAEKLKFANGCQIDRDHPKYLPAISKIFDDLISEVRRALLFYKEHFPNNNPITHLTLCGGSSQLKNLDSLLSSRLKIGARLGDVWKNLHDSRTEPILADGSTLATVVGLAIRAAEEHDYFMV